MKKLNEFVNINQDKYLKDINIKLKNIIEIALSLIYIRFPDIYNNKIDEILSNLTIIYDYDSINNILKKYNIITNINNSTSLLHQNINNELEIENKLIISLKNKSNIILLEEILHEFIHLIRYNKIDNYNEFIKIYNGIEEIIINKKNKKKFIKNKNLEEAIVEYYTLELINLYYAYTNSDDKLYESNNYKIQILILNNLCKSNNIKKLLENNFYNNTNKIEEYYNLISNDNNAFNNLNYNIDSLFKIINKDDKLSKLFFRNINYNINNFINLEKNNKKKKYIKEFFH